MGKLDGKVAIVTGGGGTIGPEYAKALGAEGASIAVLDIVDDKAALVVEELKRAGIPAIAVHCDVSSRSDTLAAAETIEREFGRIDILINNAAVAGRHDFDTLPEDLWDRNMAVNVKGDYLMAQAVLPAMKRQGWGKIVNLASVVAHLGPADLVHYTASKAAVIGFTRALARAVGEYGITVNAIAPGMTVSEPTVAHYPESYFKMHADKRSIKRNEYPRDLVGTMVFLCSPASDFVTGQTIVVDGGQIMR